MNGKIGMVLCIAVGAIVIGGLLYLAFAPVEDAEERTEARVEKRKSVRITENGNDKKSRLADDSVDYRKSGENRRPKVRMRAPEDWYAKLPSASDRTIAKHIQDAQDADNREAVFKAAEEALSSKSDEVRQAAVDALSLQGEAAMPMLLNFVNDANKDVADSAYRAWDDAVDTKDDDFSKLTAVQTVLTVAKDAEHIKSAVGKIEMFDKSRAIRELAKLAKEGGNAANAAMESYENVTGEPFESWASAELKAMAIDRENKAAEAGGTE